MSDVPHNRGLSILKPARHVEHAYQHIYEVCITITSRLGYSVYACAPVTETQACQQRN